MAVAHTYYQHVLTTEGKTVEGDPCQLLVTRMDRDTLTMMPATQVSASSRVQSAAVTLGWMLAAQSSAFCCLQPPCDHTAAIFINQKVSRILHRRVTRQDLILNGLQEQLMKGHPNLPREAPMLSKIMSSAAMSDLHWTRVPAVVIFGCVVADEEGKPCLLDLPSTPCLLVELIN